jgi:hypothetical protein
LREREQCHRGEAEVCFREIGLHGSEMDKIESTISLVLLGTLAYRNERRVGSVATLVVLSFLSTAGTLWLFLRQASNDEPGATLPYLLGPVMLVALIVSACWLFHSVRYAHRWLSRAEDCFWASHDGVIAAGRIFAWDDIVDVALKTNRGQSDRCALVIHGNNGVSSVFIFRTNLSISEIKRLESVLKAQSTGRAGRKRSDEQRDDEERDGSL